LTPPGMPGRFPVVPARRSCYRLFMAPNRAWGDMYKKFWRVLEDLQRKPGDTINGAEEFTEFFANYDDVVCSRCQTLAAWEAHDKLRGQFHKRMADRAECEYLKKLPGTVQGTPCTCPPDAAIVSVPPMLRKPKNRKK
jgi:hypothetical protein